jgi:hypothetical protein
VRLENPARRIMSAALAKQHKAENKADEGQSWKPRQKTVRNCRSRTFSPTYGGPRIVARVTWERLNWQPAHKMLRMARI